MFLNFRYMAVVMDDYGSKGINMINDWLDGSSFFLIVVLLALANGAPNMILAVVASGSSDGIFYNIGSIYGAGLFVCSTTIAMAIINSKDEGYDILEVIIKRQLGIYIVITIGIIALAIYGRINWQLSLFLLLIYVFQMLYSLWNYF